MHLLFLALEHPHLIYTLTLVSATYTFDDDLKARVREARDLDAAGWINSLNILHGEIHGADYGNTILDLWVNSVHRPEELPFTPHDLEAITCPTLIIHGDRDRYFPVHVPVTMYRAIPDAELCILPNCGHLLPAESPEMLMTVLRDFLSQYPML
jgi:pimeloyl-ACP methyl ester carboxylesterase